MVKLFYHSRHEKVNNKVNSSPFGKGTVKSTYLCIFPILYFNTSYYYHLFAEVVGGPAQNLSMVFSVGRSVITERHRTLCARDLELSVRAVEQPPAFLEDTKCVTDLD